MNYTIARTDETQGDLSVNYDINGNRYLIGIYNKESREYTHKTFDTREEAEKAYLTVVSWILNGLYSEADKRQMLLDM